MANAKIQHGNARDWHDVMKNRSKYKMHELIERLGLRAKWSSNKRGKTNFDSALVKDLVTDMSNVVSTLPKETDELIAHLSAPDSLREEVEVLLRKHGSAIWGRMSDREHLVNVGEPGVQLTYYSRDLYYEDEEDRELIGVLLHWWIGLKACNVLLARERLDRERRKKEERLRLREEEGSSREPNQSIPIAPAVRVESAGLSYGQLPRYVHTLRLDTSHSSSASPMSGTPLHSYDSPIVSAYAVNESAHALATRHVDGLRRESPFTQSMTTHISPSITVQRHTSTPPIPRVSSIQQLSADIGSLVSNFLEDEDTDDTRHAPSSTAPEGMQRESSGTQGLDVQTLQALRSYIYRSEDGPKWDEGTLLRRLETAWRRQVRTGPNRAAGDVALFAARDRAFLTWIELRRHQTDLVQAQERWRQEGDDFEARIAQHKTLMSASRDLVRNWEDIGQLIQGCAEEGLTADDVLVQAFVLLAGDSATADMGWVPPTMNVDGAVRWLREQVELEAEQAEGNEGLLYVRM